MNAIDKMFLRGQRLMLVTTIIGYTLFYFLRKNLSLAMPGLAQDYGIATRAGAHCAPLMHRALGTEAQGAVRFSFGYFNTAEETDAAIAAVREIAGR